MTDASVHDSQPFCDTLDGENDADQIWADSDYRSEALEAGLEAIGYVCQIYERGFRNHPLTEAQKQTSRDKSKVRAKVEQVFEAWLMNLGGKQVCCIGLKRVRTQLGLKDLAYNVRAMCFGANRSCRHFRVSMSKQPQAGDMGSWFTPYADFFKSLG